MRSPMSVPPASVRPSAESAARITISRALNVRSSAKLCASHSFTNPTPAVIMVRSSGEKRTSATWSAGCSDRRKRPSATSWTTVPPLARADDQAAAVWREA